METKVLWQDICQVGLDNYLLSKGTSLDTLNSARRVLASDYDDLQNYYDNIGEVDTNVLVPVDQIEGVSRVSQFTWFDILNHSILGNAKEKYNMNIEQLRFLKQLVILEENGLEEMQNIYNQTGNISFVGFRNRTGVKYYQCVDGNHRVIIAKNLGLKTIKASKVYWHDFNKKNYSLYLIYKESEKEFCTFIKETYFEIVENLFVFSKKQVVLDLLDFCEKHEKIGDYPFDIYELKKDYDSVFEMINEAEKMKRKIEMINKNAKRYHFFYRRLPRKFLEVRKHLFPRYLELKDLSKLIAIKELLDIE